MVLEASSLRVGIGEVVLVYELLVVALYNCNGLVVCDIINVRFRAELEGATVIGGAGVRVTGVECGS